MAWTWKDRETIPAPKTPSLLYNNLSWSTGRSLAYVNKSQVLVVGNGAKPMLVNTQQMVNVTQAKYIMVNMEEYLVILSTSGFQIWTADGKQLVHFLPITAVTQCAKGNYCRGVCGIMGMPTLCVGLSDGSVLVCNFEGKRVDVENTLREHQAPITDMSSSSTAFASGDDTGNIIVWHADGYDAICRFAGTGMPCTSLATRADTLVAGFVDGKVRLYHITQGVLTCEINAHCRAINALDMHSGQDIFVSAGEDAHINVWTLPSKSNPEVQLILSTHVEDALLTGVQFASDGTASFAACAYDVDQISFWRAQ